ncbi:hypothetical protein [Idiomarina aquatica]|uniref:Uncharacterized protein n=1 Tax=Idiomarina aquatica TaxID=1327752 RepID=A0AA94JDV9_9GAMM|nr:hypothetical protein [Idiomarina aquatica]RUO45197.1 hypothetical protein CWE23_04040 [Idiomarina aquatica]
MIYSIDYDNGKLSGWVSEPRYINNKISISDALGRNFIVPIDQNRPDVLKLELTKNIKCGFDTSRIFNDNLEGNFFTLLLKADDEKFEIIKFCGSYLEWRDKFEQFQVTDRKDFSIQSLSTEQIFEKYPDIIAFKLLMIRLRRGKRAFGWRGRFDGKSYQYIDKDWKFFESFFIKNFNVISKILTVRSLWSVVQTFIDFGDITQRACALAISNSLFTERFANTFRLIYSIKPEKNPNLEKQIHYWGGMLSNRIVRDDAYDIYITQNLEVLDSCPVLKATFMLILLESTKSESSILAMNLKFSDYFRSAIEHYESLFKEYLNNLDYPKAC